MEALSKPELLALLGAARAHSERNWLMILVSFWHGLRASEVVGGSRIRTVNKRKERYFHPGLLANDLRDGYIKVARAKGSLQTIHPLMDDENPLLNERKALFDFTRNMRGNQRLFPVRREQFWKLMQRYGEAANIPAHKRHPHILKHSIALQTIDSAGIHNVKQYLGHKSLKSTGAYLKVTDADAAQAIRTATRGSLAV